MRTEQKQLSILALAAASLMPFSMFAQTFLSVGNVPGFPGTSVQVPGTNVTLASLPFTVSPTEVVGSGPLTPGNVILAKADATFITPVSLNAGARFSCMLSIRSPMGKCNSSCRPLRIPATSSRPRPIS